MQQVYIRQAREIVRIEVPVPVPDPNEVLVKVVVCGVCATDLHTYNGESIQKVFPFHPGHEIAGIVEQTGAEVTDLKPGDKVVVDPLYPCGTCYFCQSNRQNHCIRVRTLGTTGPGGFSDYVLVPAGNAHKFSGIDFATACFAEPLATVVYGLQRARPGYADSVLINGAGPIGLLHLQLVLQSGVSRLVVTDLIDKKLHIARQLGASHIVNAGRDDFPHALREVAPQGFDLVIDCTGVPAVIESSIEFLRNTGRLLLFGVCPQKSEIRLNPFELYRRDLMIIGSYALNRTMGTAIRLLESGVINTGPLTGGKYKRSELEQVFDLLQRGQTSGKILIIPKD